MPRQARHDVVTSFLLDCGQVRAVPQFVQNLLPGGLSGPMLADEALALRPDLKVLYTSGYTANAVLHQGRLDAGALLLPKPYRRADLARKVRAALA